MHGRRQNIRTPRAKRPWLATSVALAAMLSGAGAAIGTSAAAAPPSVDVVVKWGTSAVVPLPSVPTDASSVQLTVTSRWAWKPTRIAVCAATVSATDCSRTPLYTTPVQNAISATTTIALPAAAQGKVRVVNTDASAKVTLAVLGFTRYAPAPSAAPAPTASATPKPTVSATPAPTVAPTVAPKPTASAAPAPTAAPSPSPTASPSPTPKPSPTVTATPTAAPAPKPSPTATTPPPTTTLAKPGITTSVGVPAGTQLTVHNGDLTVTQAGAVIDSVDIRGLLRIKAPNVTIKNSVIRGKELTGNMGLITNDAGAYHFTLTDSTIAAAYPSPYVNGIIGHNFTVRRTEIRGVVDSVHITGSDVLVENSWVHNSLYFASDPTHNGGPSHADSFQIQAGSNITIRNNRIEGARSSAMQTTQDRGVISNLTVSGNWIDGGACSLNIASGSLGPIQGILVSKNTFGLSTSIARCAIIAKTTQPVTNTANVFTDGLAVTVSRG
jgi:hypothetical protein